MSDLPEDPDPATRLYHHRTETVSEERGSGPAVVFAHGTLMDWTMFEPQLSALSDEYRTIAYNLRARTDRFQGPYDLDDLADDCRVLMDARDIDSCVLAGMSMGGFMALRFALRYPDMLDGIVLIDSMATPHDEAEREQYGDMVETAKSEGDVPDPMAEAVSHMLFGQTSIEERTDLVEHWKDRWLTYPGEAVHDEVKSWLHRPGVEDRLDEIDVPVLITHGAEDVSIEPERAEPMVDQLPDARMEVIPEAGHSSNTENPDAANAAIREFLEEVY
ncbi:alpha/beta hydrolase [Halorientalis sp. IM1011]|uniref:alpha/beta fold hydrolase n=1 Tax=Halorientalis sp. IM1011 TaxID=1932360 RepID=UPI00097CD51A|nr:alpha/beta hydrolase [Halorientalis sp. IM1011]AQL44207.1 alpha/beta hydrolase [Halorientalis sp. IM1011]